MSQVTVRFNDAFSHFDGKSNLAEWLERFETVARIQNITDLASVIPLFLTGGAFAVYRGLSDAGKADYATIRRALTAAYSPDAFQAFEEFASRRLRAGEAVNEYSSELTRLAALVAPPRSGSKEVSSALSEANDLWVKSAFVAGLPEAMKRQLKAACDLPSMSLENLVERTRQLATVADVCLVSAEKVAQRASEEPRPMPKKILCFLCNQPGHLARACSQRPVRHRSVVCYCCGRPGHVASECSYGTPAHAQRKNE